MSFSYTQLPRPFLALAPMEDVTDRVFRGLVADHAPPDVFYTEFIAAQALAARRRTTMAALPFTQRERPLIAQIWGTDPDSFFEAARLLAELDYDGIDINMGCPARKIVKKGACAGLIGNYARTSELIQASREGIAAAGGTVPLSVKTRLGISTPITDEWCGFLLEQNIDALTLHPRTAEQMSDGHADWTQLSRVTDIRNRLQRSTVIIGNGDVLSAAQAHSRAEETGVDGIMIGRGIFSNLFVFNPAVPGLRERNRREKLRIALEHTTRFEYEYQDTRNFEILKKFYKCYVIGYTGYEQDFTALMAAQSYQEARSILIKGIEKEGP
ncbi:MAG: tRNA dihydrouridine synthase [Spirochaeta sp.]